MSYSEELASRVRSLLAGRHGVSERRMFGGLAFMVNGNLCCGIVGAELMLRLGNAGVAAALARPRTRPMDFTGRVIRSMLFVEAKGVETTTELESWIALAADFASKLPEK